MELIVYVPHHLPRPQGMTLESLLVHGASLLLVQEHYNLEYRQEAARHSGKADGGQWTVQVRPRPHIGRARVVRMCAQVVRQ